MTDSDSDDGLMGAAPIKVALDPDVLASIRVKCGGFAPLEVRKADVEAVAEGVERDNWMRSAENAAKMTAKNALPLAVELAVDNWCAVYPGELGAKEANALEAAALQMAYETSTAQAVQRKDMKRHRTMYLQEVGVDELPVRLASAANTTRKSSILGRAETYGILRVEEHEPEMIFEDDDDEAPPEIKFDGSTNRYQLAKQIMDVCDTGDDGPAPGPGESDDENTDATSLEEHLERAAKKLRGVDRDHRKLTVAEMQRGLLYDDLNPFVTWLTKNASSVFASFDDDGDETLDYEELIKCIEIFEDQEKDRVAKEDASKTDDQKAAEAAEAALEAERLRDADATDDAFHNAMAAPAQQVDVRVEPGDSMPGAMLWEVGRTKTCKTRTDAPATFGNMCAARARDASR